MPAEIAESAPTAGSDADVVGQPRRLERQQAGPAEVQGRGEALVLDAGTEAPDFTLKDQNGQAGYPERLPRRQERPAGVLSARVHRHLPGRAGRDPRQPAALRERRHRHVGHLGGTATDAQGLGHRRAVSCSRCLSDFWPHGAVAQSYGVFNDDAGFANRGTFVIDRSGVIRFAEMKQPGEARDQAVWTEALTSLRSGLRISGRTPLACSFPGDGRVAQW